MHGETVRTLLRSWRWIARTSALAGGLAAGISWMLPAQWESTAILLPPDRRNDGFEYSGGLSDGLRRTFEAFHLQDRAHPSEIQRAVLRSEELARRLVRRFDLAKRWRLPSEDLAVARVAAAIETQLLPYGPIQIRVRLQERELAAEVANEAAAILEERLAELYRKEMDWERTFLREAIATHAQEAERLGVDLADWRTKRGLVDRAEQSESAAEELREIAARILDARLDRAQQARRHGTGSAAARDAARRTEELERAAATLPTTLAQGSGDRIREEELARMEKTSRFLLALHRETLANEAGHVLAVRVLDPAVPAESPDRTPLVAAVLLAVL
ncbi:MAG: Wzz/FepE/Etk N-terminal domain-containing protein, partial [bacterium]